MSASIDQPTGLSVLPVTGIGDVRPGDDLAALIIAAAPWLADGDVLVVTSKIVSKAEGSLAALPAEPGPAREAAKAAILTAETARVVATRGPTRIVQTHHGFVMAAGGIDESNVDPSHVVLLPKDPDASARALRAELRERFHLDVVVVVSDTMGRPWRIGLTDVALGVAGVDPLRDYRGERDAYGNELQVTQMSPVDEFAGAAELVKGKYDQVPVAVIRGLGIVGTPDGPGAAVLVRPAAEDMFSLGTAEARADGLRQAAELADTDGPPVVEFVEVPGDGGDVRALVPVVSVGADAVTLARAGTAIHARRCALAARGVRTAWHGDQPPPEGFTTAGVALGVITVDAGS
ncbi:MAG TPA: coenzyme F420-0:L-glutamate ligase [Micromonosporaceae bacterium]|nr:coenzyme F420-0:L-glutamate ligase [Micromonosporaceae bacterium]